MAEVVNKVVKHFKWKGPVGCAFPARIHNGEARTAANIDDSWIGTNAAKLFSKKTGCPVTVINDADAAAVAEMRFGAGKGRKDIVLLLTFGTGIGSALFINKMLIPNSELGHIIMHNGMVAEHYASDKARRRDRLSWVKWSQRVQEYLAYLEFLIDIDLIILGGGISQSSKKNLYLDYLKTDAELKTAQLQNEAGIIGAACSALTLAVKKK